MVSNSYTKEEEKEERVTMDSQREEEETTTNKASPVLCNNSVSVGRDDEIVPGIPPLAEKNDKKGLRDSSHVRATVPGAVSVQKNSKSKTAGRKSLPPEKFGPSRSTNNETSETKTTTGTGTTTSTRTSSFLPRKLGLKRGGKGTSTQLPGAHPERSGSLTSSATSNTISSSRKPFPSEKFGGRVRSPSTHTNPQQKAQAQQHEDNKTLKALPSTNTTPSASRHSTISEDKSMFYEPDIAVLPVFRNEQDQERHGRVSSSTSHGGIRGMSPKFAEFLAKVGSCLIVLTVVIVVVVILVPNNNRHNDASSTKAETTTTTTIETGTTLTTSVEPTTTVTTVTRMPSSSSSSSSSTMPSTIAPSVSTQPSFAPSAAPSAQPTIALTPLTAILRGEPSPILEELGVYDDNDNDEIVSNSHTNNVIPTELGLYQNLTYIDLSRSDFSGTIPTELGNLWRLS